MNAGLRTRLATLLVLSVIFVSGGVVGIALDRSLARTAEVTSAEPEETGGEGSTESRWIIDQVTLSPDQRARVDSVLAGFRGDLVELYREFEPVYRERVAEAREAIRAILDDEQRAHYDSLLAERVGERRGDGDSDGLNRER